MISIENQCFTEEIKHFSITTDARRILSGAAGLLPQALKTHPRRNTLIFPLWSSWSTSLNFETISNTECTHISPLDVLGCSGRHKLGFHTK